MGKLVKRLMLPEVRTILLLFETPVRPG
jgi:hypothetical protein